LNARLELQHLIEILHAAAKHEPDWEPKFMKQAFQTPFQLREHDLETLAEDQLHYRKLYWPADVSLAEHTPASMTEELVKQQVGLLIMNPDGTKPIVTLRPGDFFSMYLFEEARVKLASPWDKPGYSERLTQESDVIISKPNGDLLPPELRPVLREQMGRVLGHELKVLMLNKRSINSAPDLVFSVFPTDFEDEAKYQLAKDAILHLFPHHLRVRIAFVSRTTFSVGDYQEL
jgi:hypothetical protein